MNQHNKDFFNEVDAQLKSFSGVFATLGQMIDDGTIDRFNETCDARDPLAGLSLVVYLDQNFNVMDDRNAQAEARECPDYVTAIPLSELATLIADVREAH